VIRTAPDSSGEARSAAGRGCAVNLPSFEGPLDLLLHLIRSNEVDIADIPVALISEQYLEYLELMRQLDINLAADYLLMAATLAHLKSRMLLPPIPGDLDEEEGNDPRAELARRLAEYAVFKEVAIEFDRRPVLGRDVFTSLGDLAGIPKAEPSLHVSLFALVEAMRRVLESLPAEERHHQVALERITLQERMVAIMDQLVACATDSLRFEDLLHDAELTRHRIVMTFLAILELAKIQALRVFQNISADGMPFGPVRVRAAVDAAPDADRIAAAGEEAERAWAADGERARKEVSTGGSVDESEQE
jgi:segregation and condensation protein A